MAFLWALVRGQCGLSGRDKSWMGAHQRRHGFQVLTQLRMQFAYRRRELFTVGTGYMCLWSQMAPNARRSRLPGYKLCHPTPFP